MVGIRVPTKEGVANGLQCVCGGLVTVRTESHKRLGKLDDGYDENHIKGQGFKKVSAVKTVKYSFW